MLLGLKVLNEDATLNDFRDIGNVVAAPGADIKIVAQLVQNDRHLRYIPDPSSVAVLYLLKSDGTFLTVTGSFPFSDDRSIVQFTLSETDSANLFSQDLIVHLTEGSVLSFAKLQQGLQMEIVP